MTTTVATRPSLAEMIDPRRTALVIVDVQVDFGAPDGLYGKVGCDLSRVEPAIDRVVASRQEIDRVLDALATCSPTAKRIFHIVYATPGGSAAIAAREVGLSLQRIRQILCETRAHIRRTVEGGSR